jgi:hypothetical protein
LAFLLSSLSCPLKSLGFISLLEPESHYSFLT